MREIEWKKFLRIKDFFFLNVKKSEKVFQKIFFPYE